MPLMQGLHAIFALASTLSPLIINTFLVNINSPADPATNETSTVSMETDVNDSVATAAIATDNFNSTSRLEGVEMVGVAYLVMAGLIVSLSIPFWLLWLFYGREKKSGKPASTVASIAETTSTTNGFDPLRFIFLSLLVSFIVFSVYIEILPGMYYVAYSIKQLRWSVRDSLILMGVFFGTHLVGRIAAIPISRCVSSGKMLVVSSVLATVAYLLLFLIHTQPAVLWISTAIAGLAQSSTVATIFIWVSESIVFTSRISAIIVIGSNLSSIASPLLIGMLMEKVSSDTLIYAIIFCALGQLVSLVVLIVFQRKFEEKLKR